MDRLVAAAERLLLAAWVGGGWAIGYLAAPVLFAGLADPAEAGRLAGEMFRWMGWLGLAAGPLVLLCYRRLGGRWRQWRSALVALMWGAGAVVQFLLAPRIAALRSLPADERVGFALLHGSASALYLIASLAGLLLLLRPPAPRY